MRTIRWIGLVTITLGAAGWMLAQAEVAKHSDGEVDVRALRKQVEQLQQRLKTLEQRLTAVESPKRDLPPGILIRPKPPGSPPMDVVPSLPGPVGRGPSQGKIWGEREINGWPFYIIACEND